MSMTAPMMPTTSWRPLVRAALVAVVAVVSGGCIARATLPSPALSSWSHDEASWSSFEGWSPARLASLVRGG